MADVHLPRSLVGMFPGAPRRLEAAGATVAEVIDDLEQRIPGIRNRLLDAGPSIRTHLNVFVGGERASLATAVPADAVIHVIPAVSGGEDRFLPPATPEGRPITAEDASFAAAGAPVPAAGRLADPRALQILSTEHWSLLTARSLVYNESFARAGMFLALLSATLVALGLISAATGFSDAFLSVAALVLGLDLFVGLATLGRVAGASNEDLRYLQGMNRIRHAYLEMVPSVEDYFITSGYDDIDSVTAFYGPAGAGQLRGIVHGLTTMGGMLGVICAALTAVLTAIVVLLLTHDPGVAALVALVAFAIAFVVITAAIVRAVVVFQKGFGATFPRPTASRRGQDPRVS
ncbi:MAG TPA: MoaD/ThiS family protein [Candidatus Limnocylindria bacterium]|nr:MoaD/ThiS family protein [Candidatus Limnocylindria bacterium]